MKNVIITILVLTTLVAGYVAATSSLRMSMSLLEGETAIIKRGNLTLPINATGEVIPARRVVIKSEASGEVVEVAKRAGERVKAGELLIRLEPDNEQRLVNRARLDLKAAEARLEEARVNLEQARTADLASAAAKVQQIEATLKLAEFRAKRVEENPELFHEEERLQRLSSYRSQLAQLENAKAAYEQARLSVRRREQAVQQAEATFETYKNNLGDAEKKLAETDIIAPIDGIVGNVTTEVGEVVQGGMANFTGGTPLAVVLDMDKLIVRAEVDEADIGRVCGIAPAWARPGRAVSERMPEDLREAAQASDRLPIIRVETFPEETFQGIIERIYPEPRNVSNVVTYLVDVVIISDNRDKLLPGMRAEVEFTAEHLEDVILCPNEAIQKGSAGAYGVYIPKKDAAPDERPIEFVPIKIGLTDGAVTQVPEGLTEGMVVYTRLPAKKRSDNSRKRRGSS